MDYTNSDELKTNSKRTKNELKTNFWQTFGELLASTKLVEFYMKILSRTWDKL